MKKLLFVILLTAVLLFAASCDFFLSLFGDGSITIKIGGVVVLDASVQVQGQPPIYVGILNYVPAGDFASVNWFSGVSPNPLQLNFGQSVAFSFAEVPEGKYMIGAFIDTNGNSRYDIDEPSGAYPVGDDGPYLQDFTSDDSNITVTIYPPWGGGGLEVQSTTPDPGDLNVPGNTEISVTFNNPLNTMTATDANFYLDYSYTTGPLTTVSDHIPGVISFSPDAKILYFTVSGAYLASDWEYRVTVTTGLMDQSGESLSSGYSFTFHTQKPVIGLGNANNNWAFTTGLQDWQPVLGWSGSNLGNMTVFWDPDYSSATLNRINASSDGGMMFLAKDFQSNLYVDNPGGTNVEVTVTYWKVSGSTPGDHRLQLAVWYGTFADPYQSNPSWVLIDDDVSNTAGWVTRNAIVTLPQVPLYIGRIAVGQGGWDYTTRIKDIWISVYGVVP